MLWNVFEVVLFLAYWLGSLYHLKEGKTRYRLVVYSTFSGAVSALVLYTLVCHYLDLAARMASWHQHDTSYEGLVIVYQVYTYIVTYITRKYTCRRYQHMKEGGLPQIKCISPKPGAGGEYEPQVMIPNF